MATTTTAPHTSPTTGTGGGSGDTAVSSNALAFTGPGAVVTWAAVVGALLSLLGIVLLLVVDTPRRALARLSFSASSRRPMGSGPRAHWAKVGRWLTGR
jgi:hypothetical protein